MVVAQLTCVCGGAALVRLVSPPSKMLIFAESGINRSSTVVSSWIPLIVCHCRPLILSATCEFQCGVANRTPDEFERCNLRQHTFQFVLPSTAGRNVLMYGILCVRSSSCHIMELIPGKQQPP